MIRNFIRMLLKWLLSFYRISHFISQTLYLFSSLVFFGLISLMCVNQHSTLHKVCTCTNKKTRLFSFTWLSTFLSVSVFFSLLLFIFLTRIKSYYFIIYLWSASSFYRCSHVKWSNLLLFITIYRSISATTMVKYLK